MKSIFPNFETKKEKQQILDELIEQLNITTEEAPHLFKRLTDRESGIIYQIGNEYWYAESAVERKLTELSMIRK